jgi:hypothetical protein
MAPFPTLSAAQRYSAGGNSSKIWHQQRTLAKAAKHCIDMRAGYPLAPREEIPPGAKMVSDSFDTVIIGGGQAGLAVSY